MAYYKKRHLIEPLQSDVLILQEVAKRDISAAECPFGRGRAATQTKDLGVLGIASARYKVTESADPNLPWHLPFSVDGLNIVALWAHQLNRELRQVRVTHEVIDGQVGFASGETALLTGDFNSNMAWDREHPGRNHSMLVERPARLGLSSVYHRDGVKYQGAEPTKTYFHNRNQRFRHYIDYSFLSDGTPPRTPVGGACGSAIAGQSSHSS